MISMLKEEFRSLPIFEGFTSEQIELLETIIDYCYFPKGLVIFEQGHTACDLFILLSGEVTVRFKPYDGPPLVVAKIQSGGVFGWSAAIGRDFYTSGAVAEQESKAFRLHNTELRHFCQCQPEVAAVFLDRLANGIAERLRNTHDEVLALLTKGMEIRDDW
jgi:CRP/FNR family cyclic AMP-dependent transcriptional regulator